MPDVAAYIRHAELYGPDCILETAARDPDVSRTGLGNLKAYLETRLRTERWHRGHWEERPGKGRRQCEECGLDLPRGARPNTRYHQHCRWRKEKRRARLARKERKARETTRANAKPPDTARPGVQAQA